MLIKLKYSSNISTSVNNTEDKENVNKKNEENLDKILMEGTLGLK
jgi:hypothetical protein